VRGYDDDGYIKDKLSVTLQVLTDLLVVFKEDTDLDLNVPKTVILPVQGVTEQVVFGVLHIIITTMYHGRVGRVSFLREYLEITEPI
jgi:hypothetical protein